METKNEQNEAKSRAVDSDTGYGPGQTAAPIQGASETEARLISHMEAMRQGFQDQIRELTLQLEKFMTPPELPPTPVAVEGVMAPTLGPVNCPECGVRMQGGSLTGYASQVYDHGFEPGKNGVACKYKGQKFKPPVVFLELLKPKVKKVA